MTKQEINIFINEMKPVGDEWTEEQVEDVYGNTSLADALADRKAALGQFMDNFNKILNS